jgi:hypothetical protein
MKQVAVIGFSTGRHCQAKRGSACIPDAYHHNQFLATSSYLCELGTGTAVGSENGTKIFCIGRIVLVVVYAYIPGTYDSTPKSFYSLPCHSITSVPLTNSHHYYI